jgi:hypothetical protein
VLPKVQVIIDIPHTHLDGTQHAIVVGFRLENKEGFPVSLHAPNRCSELKWMVLSDGFVIDQSGMCNEIYDPVHLRLEGNEVRIELRPIMLEKIRYQTGHYTLKTWFWGIEAETTFYVEKIQFTKLNEESNRLLKDEKFVTEFFGISRK